MGIDNYITLRVCAGLFILALVIMPFSIDIIDRKDRRAFKEEKKKMSGSIREFLKIYEESILKENKKDMANFEPNFKIQEELENKEQKVSHQANS